MAKAELHQALTREKPAQRGRAVLFKARYIRQGDLANARHARKEPGTKSGRKRKAGNSQKESEAKRTKLGQQATRNSNAGDSEVEMQVENMVRMQEEGGAGQKYHVEDATPRKQERAPLAESSGNLCRGSRL